MISGDGGGGDNFFLFKDPSGPSYGGEASRPPTLTLMGLGGEGPRGYGSRVDFRIRKWCRRTWCSSKMCYSDSFMYKLVSGVG